MKITTDPLRSLSSEKGALWLYGVSKALDGRREGSSVCTPDTRSVTKKLRVFLEAPVVGCTLCTILGGATQGVGTLRQQLHCQFMTLNSEF